MNNLPAINLPVMNSPNTIMRYYLLPNSATKNKIGNTYN